METEVTKENFLYKSIDDAISIIRAMDMKSNVLMAFIGAIIFVLIRIDNNISALTICTILWGIGAIIAFIYGVVLPGLNPINKIKNLDKVINNEKHNILFFPIGIRDIDTYYESLNTTKDEDLLKVLSLERLKLQVFIDHKVALFKIGLYWGTLPFLFLVLITLSTHI